MGKCLMPQVFVIGGGGGDEPVGEGDYLVRYIDYDGTILKQKRVDSGGSVTAPDAPDHTDIGLTFDEWTHATTNLTSNMDVGAIYNTTDGKTHFGLRVTAATGKDVVLYLYKSDGATLTIDWGDGSSNDFTNIGSFNTGTHTYATYGDYEVKMWISSGTGTYGFGNGTTTTTVVGGSTQVQRDMLLKVYVGDKVTSINDSAFNNCRSLTSIVIPSSVTSIGDSAFLACYALTSVVIPDGVTSINDSAFNNCRSLTSIVIPSSVTSIGDSAFATCNSLTSIVIPSSVTSIGNSAFRYCYSFKTYVLERTANITTIGGTTTFEYIASSTKIYVPDALVSTYKSANNWSTYADYIYPISDKGVTHND